MKNSFDVIYSLVKVKVPEHLSVLSITLSEDSRKVMEEFSIVFVYDKPQTLTINAGTIVQTEFTEITFPLSDEWQHMATIEDDKYGEFIISIYNDLDLMLKSLVDFE